MAFKKVISAADAIALIHDGDTLATTGYGGNGTPDQLFDRLVKSVTINSSQTPQFGIVAESVDQGSGDFIFIQRGEGC